MHRAKRHMTDFLIIGSGIAGLTFAIKASAIGRVTIVTKKKDMDSNTNYAQGGIASVLAKDDTFESHINDTLTAGAGLCDPAAVDILVRSAPDRIAELVDWGTRFSAHAGTRGKPVLDLGREGGHTCNRIVHATDLTGREIERALLNKISGISSITMLENHTALELCTEHQLRIKRRNVIPRGTIHCYGAYILDNATGIVDTYNSHITLISTGGVGQIYLHTTNPDIATGDGIAMAYRAGALIADMEFIQFHPTSLYRPVHTSESFLISEAVRGEGAHLLNHRGDRFMDKVHPLKELAPRDIVARAIDKELKKHGLTNVYLDISFKKKAFLKKRFPHIYDHCFREGIDIAKEPIPVVPAAHFLCGGIVCDTEGRTSIRNLIVSGEASRTGVHGANRLASNSLLEGIVFSDRAFECIKRDRSTLLGRTLPEHPVWNKEGTFDMEEWILIQHNIEDVKRVMWDYVGIVRSDKRLLRASKRLDMLAEEIYGYYKKSTISSRIVELRNLATVARLIIQSAIERKNSIGLHYNIDHPHPPEDKVSVILQSGRKPRMAVLSQEPQ